MNRRHTPLAMVGLWIAGLACGNACAHAQGKLPEYTARVVLRLDFGLEPDQIYINWGPFSDRVSGPLAAPEFTGDGPAPSGPRCFAVDAAGDIYISHDRLNAPQVIKKFAPAYASRLAGSLVMYTAPSEHMYNFVVSPQGIIFANDERLGVSRLDEEGRVLWSRSEEEMLAFFRQSPLAEGWKACSAGGGTLAIRGPFVLCPVRAEGPPRGDGSGLLTSHWFGVLLDGDGNFVAVLPTDDLAPDGRVYRIIPSPWGREPLQLRLQFLNAEGEVVQDILPEVTLDGEDLFADCDGVRDLFVDPQGGIVAVARSSMKVADRLAYGSILEAYTQLYFVRYDPEGRFLEKWSFPHWAALFLFPWHPTIIGHDGKIYHLAFDDTGVDVIQYAPGATSGSSLPLEHLVAFRLHDTVYTRLRHLASECHGDLYWEDGGSAAVVTGDGRALSFQAASDLVLSDAGDSFSLGAPVQLFDGELWVPAPRVRPLLVAPQG
jgi:hypothetical protein